MPRQPITILLIEDNPGDVRLTQEVFRDCGLANKLVIAGDGEQALGILGFDLEQPDGGLKPVKLPDVIVMDLNLPNLDGRELIDILQRQLILQNIPLIILTNSLADRVLTVSYNLPPNAYIEKPLDLVALVKALQSYPQFGYTITKQADQVGEGV